MKRIGFLDEAEGVRSSIRLIFVIGMIWNMLLSSYLAITEVTPATIIAVFTAISTALGAMKLTQRQQENKIK